MTYPIVIHKDESSDYGVTIPDLPGCFSAGSTLDEALAMAREAAELHVEGLLEEGLPVPEPTPIQAHRRKREFAGGVWAAVSVELARLRKGVKRVNVTLPERLLERMDRFARRTGETRSGLLVRAVNEYLVDQGAKGK